MEGKILYVNKLLLCVQFASRKLLLCAASAHKPSSSHPQSDLLHVNDYTGQSMKFEFLLF